MAAPPAGPLAGARAHPGVDAPPSSGLAAAPFAGGHPHRGAPAAGFTRAKPMVGRVFCGWRSKVPCHAAVAVGRGEKNQASLFPDPRFLLTVLGLGFGFCSSDSIRIEILCFCPL